MCGCGLCWSDNVCPSWLAVQRPAGDFLVNRLGGAAGRGRCELLATRLSHTLQTAGCQAQQDWAGLAGQFLLSSGAAPLRRTRKSSEFHTELVGWFSVAGESLVNTVLARERPDTGSAGDDQSDQS